MAPAIALAIGGALFSAGAPLIVVNFFAIGLGASLISLGVTAGLSLAASYALSSINRPDIPKPADGKINLKQNVPSRVRIYGRVKKGGDYLLFEERNGVAYHLINFAASNVVRYHAHWREMEL